MRLLALGDVHGCFNALRTLEKRVPFETDDTFVALGDYVDRGPNSCSVVEWMIRRFAEGRLVPLLGNHEIMMMDARHDHAAMRTWMRYGARETLDSYFGDLDDVPAEHWRFMEKDCRRFHETDTHFFVHATVFPKVALADQPELALFWERFDDPGLHVSGKTMVCGHTAQKSGLPRDIGHAVCIDTWAYGGGWLTCFEPATKHCWQANEAGDFRILA